MPNAREALPPAGPASDPGIDFSYSELLAELVREALPALDVTCEVTVAMLVAATGVSSSKAKETLDQRVAEGRYTKRRVMCPNGHPAWAYRKA